MFGFNQNATKIIVLHKEAKLPDDQKKTKNEQWDNLVNMLPDNDVRYAVADVHYNTSEGSRTDMVFVTWAPETATIKQRMLMASSKDALKNALVGCRTTIQACCYPDLDLKTVVEKFKGTLD